MNCEEVQTLLPDFFDDALSPITRYSIENHLKTCEACHKQLGEISILFHTITDSSLEIPGPKLKENFDRMLGEEMLKLEKKNQVTPRKPGKMIALFENSYAWKIAVIVVVFLSGAFFGIKWKTDRENPSLTQINELKNEVKDVKEMMVFTMLKEESASDRIQAVNFVNDMPNPDQKVMYALLNTLNHDKNVNVRLAALYSLAKFSDNRMVRDSLVNSLARQTEPVVQIVLINLLTERKESKAIKPIQDILSNEKTLKAVKDIAQKGLKTL